MGYTHYWSIEKTVNEETWWSLTNESSRLIRSWKGLLCDLRITDEYLSWNGGGESFILAREPGKDRGFCKPGGDDVLMCAVLLVAASHGFEISSDAAMGSGVDRWPVAAKWASKALGRKIEVPWHYKFKDAVRGVCDRTFDKLPYRLKTSVWHAQWAVEKWLRPK